MGKDPEHYGPVFGAVEPGLTYVWPVRSPNVIEAEERRERNGLARAERVARKAEIEVAKAARRRSMASKKAARTRKANAAASRAAPEDKT